MGHSTKSPVQTYDERAPAQGLTDVASAAWVQTVAAHADHYQHCETPHGGFELRFSMAAGLRVVGPQSAPTVTEVTPGTTEMGLRFKPGAALRVLGVPGAELVDAEVAADAVMGAHGRLLAERLSAAQEPEHGARILQHDVLRRLANVGHAEPVVDRVVALLWADANVRVDHLATEVGLSPRQLRRRCQQVVGMSPKALQRVMRFQLFQALAQRHLAVHGGADGARLAVMAAAAGYVDQAHLARECLRLAGAPPATRMREMSHKCADHDHSATFTLLTQGHGH